MILTAKERVALLWLHEHVDDRFASSALERLYEDRLIAGERDERFPLRPSTNRRHGWRRTSGAVMTRMEKKGALVRRGSDGYTQMYVISAEAKEELGV